MGQPPAITDPPAAAPCRVSIRAVRLPAGLYAPPPGRHAPPAAQPAMPDGSPAMPDGLPTMPAGLPPMPAQALQALSAAERGRLAQFRQAADQWRLLLGRTLVRSTLQGEWGIAWAPLELSALGRPRLAPGHGGPPVDFNLSHAGEWVVCAFSDDAAVGIDIAARAEFRDWEQFASGYLHANERRAMAAAPAPGQAARAARYWTLKEAILKCAGFGLQVDPRELELQLEPRATLARAHPRLPPPERLILDERQLEGEPLALAVQPPGLAAGTALAIDIRQVPWDALVGRFQP